MIETEVNLHDLPRLDRRSGPAPFTMGRGRRPCRLAAAVFEAELPPMPAAVGPYQVRVVRHAFPGAPPGMIWAVAVGPDRAGGQGPYTMLTTVVGYPFPAAADAPAVAPGPALSPPFPISAGARVWTGSSCAAADLDGELFTVDPGPGWAVTLSFFAAGGAAPQPVGPDPWVEVTFPR